MLFRSDAIGVFVAAAPTSPVDCGAVVAVDVRAGVRVGVAEVSFGVVGEPDVADCFVGIDCASGFVVGVTPGVPTRCALVADAVGVAVGVDVAALEPELLALAGDCSSVGVSSVATTAVFAGPLCCATGVSPLAGDGATEVGALAFVASVGACAITTTVWVGDDNATVRSMTPG